MNLGLVLLVLPTVCALEHAYNGFNSCGMDGWHCAENPSGVGLHIIFNCADRPSKNGRVWVWSERFPTTATRFTVMNCNHLQLHTDCSRYIRETTILDFRAININKLEILQPSVNTLHDSAPVPRLPERFYLENIAETTFYGGLFQNENDYCSYNSEIMQQMILKNVSIKNIPRHTFLNKMDELVWSQVTVEKIETDAMVINGSIVIQDSHFHEIPAKAMNISGKKIIFTGNTIGEIYPKSINIFSDNFILTGNRINEIMAEGLSVRSSHVGIDRNRISHLARNALKGINPCYYTTDTAYKVTYTFTENIIEQMSPLSLHCNWTAYENTCLQIKLDGNKFDCTCYNIVWLDMFKNDKKNLNETGFYRTLLNTTHHCGTSVNCTLSSILPYVCHNETLSPQCAGLQENETLNDLSNTTELTIEIEEKTPKENRFFEKSKPDDAGVFDYENPEKMRTWENDKVGNTYFKDNSNPYESSRTNFPFWIIVFVFVFLAALNVLVYLTWYFRRKKNTGAVKIYKYEKKEDSDKLIIRTKNEPTNIECENISYQE